MNKKAVVGLVIVVLIVSVFGAVFLMGSPEARFTEDNIFDPSLRIRNFEDSNISIVFVDDPLLNYRYSYELEAGSSGLQVITYEYDLVEFTSDGTIRANSFNLTLGSASHYELIVYGSNNTIAITYSNNASVSGQRFSVNSPGSVVYFTLMEDVNVEDVDFSVRLLHCFATIINVDLPVTMNGDLSYASSVILDLYLASGWDSVVFGYETDITLSPKLDLYVGHGLMMLWLRR